MSRLIGTAVVVWVIAALAILSPPSVVKGQVPMTGAGLGAPIAGSSYIGPGDVVSGAVAWWGLRAYSAAKTGTKIANVCNSGDANCADINSLSNGNFDVTTAQGSPLNCGGAGGTCTIKTLYDQSGNTNCSAAACDVTNATAANRPTLVFNCINTSLPCMNFVRASSQVLTNSAGISSQTQPNTFSYVALSPDNLNTYAVAGTGTSTTIGASSTNNLVYEYSGSANFTATAAQNQTHSIQNIMNGASSELYIDGTGTTPGTNPGTTAASGAINIGSDGFSDLMTGKIEEVGPWNQDFSASSNTKASAMCHNQFKYWATVTSC